MKKFLKNVAAPAALFALMVEPSLAGQSLPWDGPIQRLQSSLTGPVATGISTVAFLAAGASLIFGGDELGGIAKKSLFIVLGIAMVVLGNQFLSSLGLVGSGALLLLP